MLLLARMTFALHAGAAGRQECEAFRHRPTAPCASATGGCRQHVSPIPTARAIGPRRVPAAGPRNGTAAEQRAGPARSRGRHRHAHRGARRSTCRPRSTASAATAIRDAQPQVNISESLGGVPGLLARDRQNYAQDVQISVRGFGARSTFGIRGVRLYVDGIPATLPDGQGQISNVDLGSADRIEVLRGPFSALYGNSSGGVIQVFTEEGAAPPTRDAASAGGSYGTLRLGAARRAARAGGFGYVVSAQRLRDRRLPRAQRGRAQPRQRQAHLAAPTTTSKLTLVANSVALPKAQDPLGLTPRPVRGRPAQRRSVGDRSSTPARPSTRRSSALDLRAPPRRRELAARAASTAATATPSSSRRSRSARRPARCIPAA